VEQISQAIDGIGERSIAAAIADSAAFWESAGRR